MKIRLNLATKPLVNNRRFLVGAGVAGSIGMLALLALSVTAFRSWRANREIRRETDALHEHIRQSMQHQQALQAFFDQGGERQKMDRAGFLNALILQRSFPWIKLFEDLESELPAGVRVVNIAPHLKGGHVEVKIVVGADSDENKLKFLKALEDSRSFSEIQVRQETHPKQSPGETDRVLLELDAWYQTT
jgi:Tfp pilus assembly protein PilN